MIVKQYLTGYNDRENRSWRTTRSIVSAKIKLLAGYDPTLSFYDREISLRQVAYRGLNVV